MGGLAIKLAILALAALLDISVWLASQIGDLNVILNVATLAIALAIGIPVVRSKREIEAKNSAIKTWRENAEAEEARGDRLGEELTGCKERADREHERRVEAEKRIERLEGQIEELRPYGEAFKEISGALARVETVTGTSLEQLGELVMQSTSLTAQHATTLEKIDGNLERLADRLGAGGDRPAQLPD